MAAVATIVLAFSLVGASPARADGLPNLAHFYDAGTEVVPSTIACNPEGLAVHGSASFGTQAGDRWHEHHEARLDGTAVDPLCHI